MMINKRLIKEMGETKQYIGMQVLLQWAALLCNICLIFYISDILWEVVDGNAENISLPLSAGVFAVVIAARRVLLRLEAVYSHRSSEYVKKKLRHRIYEHLLKVGEKYEKTFSTSEILQVAAEGVEQLEIYFGKYLPQLFYSLLAPVTLFILVSFMSVKVALILFLCVPLIPVSIIAIQKFAKKLLAKYWGSYVRLGDHFLDNIQGLTTLKVYQSDAYKNEEMNKDAEHFRKITMKVLTMQLNSVTLMDLIAYGGSALGVIFSCLELQAGNLNMMQALAIILLAAEFFIPLRLLGSFFHIAMNGMAASDKMFRLLDMEAEGQDTDNKPKGDVSEEGAAERKADRKDDDSAPYAVSAKQVIFAYEEQQPILKEVTVNIPSNSFVSIVGASGCGKSTLVSLFMGYQTAQSGKVLICGRDIRTIPVKERMKRMTLVSFQNYLFKGSVRENLLMGDSSASDEKLLEVLAKVNLYEFFQTQDGLDTMLDEQAANLSGGQKQRLCIARALLHDSELYIFDEATSNIDVESEEIILQLIRNLAKEKTVIQITHRLANVTDSDRIYMMQKGLVIEDGTHEELLGKQGAYADIYKLQRALEEYREEEAV